MPIYFPTKMEELCVFYPQIKREQRKITGWLWWKKVTNVVVWHSFYETGREKLFPAELENDFRDALVSCQSKEDAQKIIDGYENQTNEKIKKSYAKLGVYWDDERYVKIHEIIK